MADEISAIRTMLAKDVISAKLASAYVTVDGNRYLLFQAKSLEATIEKEKEEVAILGRLIKGNKSVSAKGSGTLTIYKNTSLFENMTIREWILTLICRSSIMIRPAKQENIL